MDGTREGNALDENVANDGACREEEKDPANGAEIDQGSLMEANDGALQISDISGEVILSVERAFLSSAHELMEEIEARLGLPVPLQRLFADEKVLDTHDRVDGLTLVSLVELPPPPLTPEPIHDRRSTDGWVEIGSVYARGARHGFRVACEWQDQGWGNKKGAIVVRLHRRGSGIICEEDCFGICQRQHGLYRVSKVFTPEGSRVAAEAEDHDTFTFHYRVGGGGGHTLEIRDFVAELLDAPAADA